VSKSYVRDLHHSGELKRLLTRSRCWLREPSEATKETVGLSALVFLIIETQATVAKQPASSVPILKYGHHRRLPVH
jgi:hypothetical protein